MLNNKNKRTRNIAINFVILAYGLAGDHPFSLVCHVILSK